MIAADHNWIRPATFGLVHANISPCVAVPFDHVSKVPAPEFITTAAKEIPHSLGKGKPFAMQPVGLKPPVKLLFCIWRPGHDKEDHGRERSRRLEGGVSAQ